MRNFIILLAFILIACGKHESESSGFTATGNLNEGLKDGSTQGLLKTAMDAGELPTFLALIAQGVPVDTRLLDAKNSTLLIYSATKNLPKFTYYLVTNGADLQLTDDDGNTAFQVAESIGSRDRVLMILDPNRQKQAQLELFDAVKKKKVSTILAKLNAGADPNFVDEEAGETPLTQSVLLKKAANVIKILAEWKDPEIGLTATDINFPNRAGVTPFGFAILNNNTDAITILKNLNAKETL